MTALWLAGLLLATPDQAAAMDCEVPGAWVTAPPLTDLFPASQLWSTRTIPFTELAGGATLSTDHVKSGRTALRWADHPRWPTIATSRVPRDWTGATELRLWVWSDVATGEEVTLAVESDGPETIWHDRYRHDFRVDWTGWRELVVPLALCQTVGRPAGWQSVDGVACYTKIDHRQPNPATVLYLDSLRLDPGQGIRDLAIPPVGATGFPVSGQAPASDLSLLNHPWPELPAGKVVTTPIRYGAYFAAERALFDWYPRFVPGPVSVAPDGRAWQLVDGHLLETRGADGRWTTLDVLPSVIPYLREQLGFTRLELGNSAQGNETAIRWDADGDAYLLLFVTERMSDWRSRKGLLLHSRDGLRSWDVHLLPTYFARFEKLVGHNPDALLRPPVILLTTYHSPTTISLLLPEKGSDGRLLLPPPVHLADEAIGAIPHSGEANQILSHGDRVYLVYGQLKVLPGKTKESGAPAWATVYDRATGQLAEPVLVGCGGINAEDGHNWPALAVDSRGTLQVVINGHHNPFVSTHSLRPWDISAWSEPEQVAAGTSYAGLVCGPDDTLYTVTRCSHPGYYFRLSLHRKRPGQPWEPPRTLVEPFKPYYEVWMHKLTVDPGTGRLFLWYWSQSPSICLFRDEYEAYRFIWPDREQRFQATEEKLRLPLGSYRSDPRKYEFYSPPPSEPSLLLSDDGGETWRLATSGDF